MTQRRTSLANEAAMATHDDDLLLDEVESQEVV